MSSAYAWTRSERNMLVGAVVVIFLISVVAIFMSAIGLGANTTALHLQDHSYCFRATDANFVNDAPPPPPDDDDDQNVAVGRVTVLKRSLCYRLQYLMYDNCTLDHVGLYGPVDFKNNHHENGPELIQFDDNDLSADLLKDCVHLKYSLYRKILAMPVDYYIGFNFTGSSPQCERVKVRQHLTNLCRTSESVRYEVDDDDDDDDDDHHHHHHHHDDDDDDSTDAPTAAPSPPIMK